MNLSFEKKIGKNLKIGMLFPGQGSQYLGMGKDFYDNERIFQELFEDAIAATKENFIKICFSSSEKQLQETIIAQTGIFLVSAATYVLLNQKYGIVPDLVAGHSLGEYSAVFAAGGFNFFDALYLLNRRAKFMKAAMAEQDGGLLAVMNLDLPILESICNRYDIPETNTHVAEIAIFNSPTQVVVSGRKEELNQIADEVQIIRGKAIMLPVAGAYHSRLLKKAEQDYSLYLVKADFNDLKIPLINNIMAKKVQSADQVKLSLVKQTSSHIYWWDSMQYFKDMDIIIEVGPGNILTKMIKREWPTMPIYSINSYSDIENLLGAIDSMDPISESV